MVGLTPPADHIQVQAAEKGSKKKPKTKTLKQAKAKIKRKKSTMDEQVDRLVQKVLAKFKETPADRRFSKSATLTTSPLGVSPYFILFLVLPQSTS